MPTLPLITHPRPDAVLAWREDRPITAAAFLRAARALAARLPPGAHTLNLCADRYHFAVAIAAALLGGRCSLLPSSHAPEVIRHLHALAPDMICLTDGGAGAEVLAQLRCPVLQVAAGAEPIDATAIDATWRVPRIPAGQLAALIFTSGSTGTPVPHAKHFGALVRSVRAEARRLGPPLRGGAAILGTVPPQHMFGFESSVLLPLQSGGALCADRPFFPADIAAALQRLPRPRVLCSTPVHLRALVESRTDLPPLDLFLCATALLEAPLACQIEERYGAPLLEIYGSTETGQIASRRTTRGQSWQLWPGVRLLLRGEDYWAQGGHVGPPTRLADVLEPLDARHFLLHGRTADLVNVAGKRSSLAYLSHQLNAIPGVHDGAFFIREDTPASLAGVTRLAAFAVAPQLDAARIIAALRERIDPVFLPRPLLLVERLPRNDTGKLPQHTLHTLVAQQRERAPDLFE
ncbi:MAG TPA: AMP-binding protein [Steroidobacteraceae bacterium]|jgi:acyl-coenzyme A synthetase/AMP-(fatty) acid ligase|nr:AMP-binding protein [Steroidobacteraceae bacterium]